VQASLEGCARDQDMLSKAVEVALGRQKDFDLRYRDKLSSAGGDLVYGAGGAAPSISLAATDEATLDDLFARYTMERERDVHRDFLRSFGVVPKEPEKTAMQADADDGLELF
jgi:hypothetical protein